MRSLVWHGPYDLRVEQSPRPALEAEEALIRVSHAGICGSDLTLYAGKNRRAKPPLIMGHEFSGEVVEINSPHTDLRPGDRVVVEPLLPCGECYVCREGAYSVCLSLRLLGIDVNGAFAEYARVPIRRVYRLPDSVSLPAAALIEPAAVAVHAVRRSRARLGSHAVVLGGGPIGMLVALVARIATGMPVHLLEISPWRMDLARKLGFEPIDAGSQEAPAEVLDRTAGRGADILFDAAGVPATVAQQPVLTRIRGQVVMVAMPKEPIPVDLTALSLREIDLVGVRVYDSSDYQAALSLMAGNRLDVHQLISHVLPLEQGKEGIELARKADASMKVLLTP